MGARKRRIPNDQNSRPSQGQAALGGGKNSKQGMGLPGCQLFTPLCVVVKGKKEEIRRGNKECLIGKRGQSLKSVVLTYSPVKMSDNCFAPNEDFL